MNKKVWLLLPLIFLLTGCGVTYNLEIVDNDYIETVVFSLPKNMEHEDIIKEIQNTVPYFSNDFDEKRVYKKKVLKNNSQLYKVKYEYTSKGKEEYLDSRFLSTCFDTYNIFDEGEQYSLLTSVGFKCINYNYINTNDIVIGIKTNHVVSSHNADRVDKDTYIWVFNEENSEYKNIKLNYMKDEYVFNYDNIIIKVMIVIVIMTFILAICYSIGIKFAKRRVNKINRL